MKYIFLVLHTHIGMFVSESKFQANPSAFIPLIQNCDTAGLEALITKPEVERALLARLRKKATLYARELGMDGEPIVVSDADADADDKKQLVRPAVNGNGNGTANGNSSNGDVKTRKENGKENGDVGPAAASGCVGVNRHKFRIEVGDVERLYEDWIIPLTKEVEVSHIFMFISISISISISIDA